MRSTLHGPEAWLLKSKKPHVQDLIERCKSMTEEEIDALPEKPDVKKGLHNIRKSHLHSESANRAELLADMMIAKHHPELSRQNT
jgi:hypothetical protein